MLYIRKLKPKLNTQVDSELFTLVIRNAKLETANEKDIEKYPFRLHAYICFFEALVLIEV